jgi:hypothetical protein
MVANIATAIPEGIVVLLEPAPLVDTKSGPQIVAIATAIHIAKIASDAHISTTRTRWDQCRVSGETAVGGCEIVDMSHLLPSERLACCDTLGIRGRADRPARNYWADLVSPGWREGCRPGQRPSVSKTDP